MYFHILYITIHEHILNYVAQGVNHDKQISGYDTLKFANFRYLKFNTYVNNGIFETCFGQSAKGETTAWDVW